LFNFLNLYRPCVVGEYLFAIVRYFLEGIKPVPCEAWMVLIEEYCALCGVTYPYYSLYRCRRCGRLYCRSCFLYDVDGKITCLRCAKRSVTPKVSRSKYNYLGTYLANRARYSNHVTLTFNRIEEIIGERLPLSAYYHKHWWSNTRNRSPSEFWLTVGWNVHDINLEKKEVTFIKEKQTATGALRNRRKRKSVSAAFKALAYRRKPESL
jgi:hypothetical protein